MKKRILGLVIGLIGFAGLWYFNGWETMISIILILWSSNIENSKS